MAQPADPPPYESRHRSTEPQDPFRASPYRRAAAHRATPEDPRSWRRHLPVRPEIALLAVGIVVLVVGVVGAARLIMAPAASSPPTPSGDGASLSVPSDQAAATSPAGTPGAGATTMADATTQGRQPLIEKRIVTETQVIAFATRTVRDNTLAKGTSTVRTSGVPGVRTLTYQVTFTNGVQTAKTLVRSVVTKEPVTEVVAVGTKPSPRSDPDCPGHR